MTSFKAPQPTPLGMVLTIARAVGLVSAVDDVVIVPLSEWQALQAELQRLRDQATRE